MSANSGNRVDMSALPENTGVGAPPRAVTMSECGSAVEMVLWSKAVNWSVAGYKSK